MIKAMTDAQIARIKQKLAELRERDPQGTVLFGATAHQYQLKPPASAELLAQFENKHQVRLPDSYRQFLLQIGNGGAGPYYGLWELSAECEAEPDEITNKVGVRAFSSLPEHLAANCHEEIQNEEGYSQEMREKALVICSQGCTIETYLPVEGPFAGQVWSLDIEALAYMGYGFWAEVPAPKKSRAEVDSTINYVSEKTNWQELAIFSINPFVNDGSESSALVSLTFLDWYEHWLDAGLHFLNS